MKSLLLSLLLIICVGLGYSLHHPRPAAQIDHPAPKLTPFQWQFARSAYFHGYVDCFIYSSTNNLGTDWTCSYSSWLRFSNRFENGEINLP